MRLNSALAILLGAEHLQPVRRHWVHPVNERRGEAGCFYAPNDDMMISYALIIIIIIIIKKNTSIV
jgi:hypothetical protein